MHLNFLSLDRNLNAIILFNVWKFETQSLLWPDQKSIYNIYIFKSWPHFSGPPPFLNLTAPKRLIIGRLADYHSKQEFSSPSAFKKVQSRQKKLCVLKIFCSRMERLRLENRFFTWFDIKKSHPAKNRFLISTFLYLNKIWRTNSYLKTLHILTICILKLTFFIQHLRLHFLIRYNLWQNTY